MLPSNGQLSQQSPKVTAPPCNRGQPQALSASPPHVTMGWLHRPCRYLWRSGASAGIGWAVCEALAAAGLRVVAVARRRERLEALQQQLVAAGVPIADFLPVVCDITKVP